MREKHWLRVIAFIRNFLCRYISACIGKIRQMSVYLFRVERLYTKSSRGNSQQQQRQQVYKNIQRDMKSEDDTEITN
jgi:hypothetical protein